MPRLPATRSSLDQLVQCANIPKQSDVISSAKLRCYAMQRFRPPTECERREKRFENIRVVDLSSDLPSIHSTLPIAVFSEFSPRQKQRDEFALMRPQALHGSLEWSQLLQQLSESTLRLLRLLFSSRGKYSTFCLSFPWDQVKWKRCEVQKMF